MVTSPFGRSSFMLIERNKVVGLKAKKLVFESEHPYAHNADRKQAVRVEGATKLIITFDDRSR